jgi:hypothetical protein
MFKLSAKAGKVVGIQMPLVETEKIFEIKDFQTYFGAPVLNVYYYRAIEGTAPTAEGVANSFHLQKVQALIDIQNTGINHTNLEVTELTSVSNFVDYDINPTNGTVTGAILANFFAVSFRYLRTTRETRGGWKRICGMIEENSLGGGWTTAYQTDCTAVAAELGDNMPVGILNLQPIILSRRYTALPVRELLPVSEWYYNPVAGVQFVNRTTTQNSRKTF